MIIMRQLRVMRCTLVAACVIAMAHAGTPVGAAQRDEKGKKPSIVLKVTPQVAISPAKIRVSVELRGGADDYEDYYCPTIEWDWDDDTRSESTEDCEPYSAGHSSITRRYSAAHTYEESGVYKATFKIKRKDKVLALASVNVQVQPGLNGR